ncbi:MAG TPA: hypothetical protein VLA24_09290 [Pseudomonadales bacterium]|nr:hypothetical protein [Pseudomonadales bacterium]
MLRYIALTLLSTGLIAGLGGYAPQPITLEPGQIYRTGSPLSQPGLLGLIGGMAGTHTGGGYERWNGPQMGPNANAWEIDGAWSPATATEYQTQSNTLDMVTATKLFDASPGDGQNRPRAEVPDCAGQLLVSFLPDATLGSRMVYTCKGG